METRSTSKMEIEKFRGLMEFASKEYLIKKEVKNERTNSKKRKNFPQK